MHVDPRMQTRNDKTELRGLAPADLVQALDAIALARNMDRNEYVVRVLSEHVRAYLLELSVVRRVLHGNPLLTEDERN